MLYNQNKSCVESCKKHCFKNPLFKKKTHCFPTSALFYPIVLKRKIITESIIHSIILTKTVCMPRYTRLAATNNIHKMAVTTPTVKGYWKKTASLFWSKAWIRHLIQFFVSFRLSRKYASQWFLIDIFQPVANKLGKKHDKCCSWNIFKK